MRLTDISFGSIPRLPGLRPTDLGRINLERPGEALRGWRLFLRGTLAFFVSPPGWTPDVSQKNRNPKGPVVIYQMDAREVILHWSASDDELELVLKGGKYESPAFGTIYPSPVVSDKPLLAQVPAGQMGDV